MDVPIDPETGEPVDVDAPNEVQTAKTCHLSRNNDHCSGRRRRRSSKAHVQTLPLVSLPSQRGLQDPYLDVLPMSPHTTTIGHDVLSC
jgi:hypothetical protein